MKKYLIVFLLTGILIKGVAQNLQRPKLVVGMVVDQMRCDYLYRYYDRYGSNGFKRLLREGFSCENTMIPYAQTVTAAGHACVYTGSVPAINGIVGNEWYDKTLKRTVYCVEDDSVKIIGGDKTEPMSPKNLWTTTICDELRLATNFKNKVIGIALKDRGAVLPAGHTANAAYWYDGATGNWISSTYYMDALPSWVENFNQKKWPDSFYAKNWNTLYPISTYIQSDKDNMEYEGKFGHEAAPVFPHELQSVAGKDYGIIRATPYGNTFTFNFAKEALKAESLGKNGVTDFLTISLSSPDYIGHQFGPNSIEQEDDYLRLDKDLADFLAYLDKEIGKGQYLFFLTADHAVAHVPAFLQSHKIEAKSMASILGDIEKKVEEKFKVKHAVVSTSNYHIYLNDPAIDSARADKKEIKKFIIALIDKNPDLLTAFDCEKINEVTLPQPIKDMFLNGYNIKRGGDILFIVKPGSFYGGKTGTTHGSWYPYDAHIPLLWFGWNINAGKKLNREVYMTDIAPTIAALLHIQMPSGSIGHVIEELSK
ncbi:MAG: alkaline phosphatase family protein [Bacteroidetes bacterium]|nr:alkaline phosphatase family protein [Bacteroidota bacterium]